VSLAGDVDIASCLGPASSLAPLRVVEGGSLSGSRRTTLVPGIMRRDQAVPFRSSSLSFAVTLRLHEAALGAVRRKEGLFVARHPRFCDLETVEDR
jgi:hypothetical protein